MTQNLAKVVDYYREKGIRVTDDEAESVYQYCQRKMEVAGIQSKDEYLPLLFADELRNHLIKIAINAASELLKQVKDVL